MDGGCAGAITGRESNRGSGGASQHGGDEYNHQRRSGLHQTDDAYLVNTSNLFVTQPRLNPDPAILQRGVHTEAVNRCLAHNSGVTAAPDYRDVPGLHRLSLAPGTPTLPDRKN